jgi:hypothetical protein
LKLFQIRSTIKQQYINEKSLEPHGTELDVSYTRKDEIARMGWGEDAITQTFPVSMPYLKLSSDRRQ